MRARPAGATLEGMSTQPEDPTPTTTNDDPDGDPGMLNPRTGGAASGEVSDASGDPDADPDQLNPRGA